MCNPYLVLLRMGFAVPVCCQTSGALLPHRFTLTGPKASGLLSVALSVGSPRPVVNRHPVSVKSGLSSLALRQARFSDQLARVLCRDLRQNVNQCCVIFGTDEAYIPARLPACPPARQQMRTKMPPEFG